MKVIPIPPDCTMHSNAALLSGDFKTRHPLLGSEGSTIGQSGKVYFDYLRNTNDPILLLCLLEKTLSERQIMQYGSIQSAHTPKHCERNPVLCIIFPFCKSSPPSNAFVPPNIMINSFKGLAAGMKTCSWLVLIFLMKLCQQDGNIITQLQTKSPAKRRSLFSRGRRTHQLKKDGSYDLQCQLQHLGGGGTRT